uniref:Uncharacterized protein n=1 Tax=Arundo donax TaxID=35708 RepID=A0A0A8YFE7_ARUDO
MALLGFNLVLIPWIFGACLLGFRNGATRVQFGSKISRYCLDFVARF